MHIQIRTQSLDYQPPKFHQFHGKGNLKQWVAHFVKIYNNAHADGGLMMKQFVRKVLPFIGIPTWNSSSSTFANKWSKTSLIDSTTSNVPST